MHKHRWAHFNVKLHFLKYCNWSGLFDHLDPTILVSKLLKLQSYLNLTLLNVLIQIICCRDNNILLFSEIQSVNQILVLLAWYRLRTEISGRSFFTHPLDCAGAKATSLIPLAKNHSFEKRMSKKRSTADLRSQSISV